MKNAAGAVEAAPTPRPFSKLLVSLVIASALPLVALSVALVTLSALSQREQVLASLETTARAFQLAIDRELVVMAASLQALATSPAVDAALAAREGGSAEAFRAQAANLMAQRPDAIRNVVLYAAPSGETVFDSLAGPGRPQPAASPEAPPEPVAAFDPEALFAQVAETRRPYVSDLFYSPEAGQFLVAVGAPVLRGSQVAGVLAASLRPENLGALLRASGVSDLDTVAVVDRAGVIVARSRDAETFVGQPAVEDIRAFQENPDSVSAVFRTETVDGSPVYGALHRLSEAPWSVAYGAPRKLIDGPVRREVLVSGAAGALALGFFLLAASWQGRRLGREVSTLGADAAAIGRGEPLPARVERVQEVAEVRAALRAGVAALAASEERMRLATDGADMATFDVDLGTGEMILSKHGYRMLGLDPKRKATRDQWLARVHPADLPKVQEEIARSESEDRVLHALYRIRRADDGAERWIENYGRHLRGGQEARRLIGVGFDVTERRLTEERQRLLIREVDHRAKNVLAVVQAILRLTRADDVEAFAATVEGRVQALARAHELLARDRWQGAGLRPLAEQELAGPIEAGGARLEGPALQLRPEAVQPLAMVLHELATNAAKHGALSRPGGEVLLSWGFETEDGPLKLRWLERGGPRLAGPPAAAGFGSRMIKATVRGQLGGQIDYAWSPEGLECEIALAAKFVAPGAAAAAPPPRPAAAPDPAGRLKGRRVLVAEDEALIAADLATILSGAGCEVLGPEAALAQAQALARSAARIDAAVLDINLLGESSLPLGEALLARGVPVVLLTGYGTLTDEWKRRKDFAGLLRKPVDPDELQAALARALAPRTGAGAGAPGRAG